MIITLEELRRRVTGFKKVLPGNTVEQRDWTNLEISRVLFKMTCVRTVPNPAIEIDKHDMQYELRKQYYDGIKLEAIAKAAKLREQTAQLKAARLQQVY